MLKNLYHKIIPQKCFVKSEIQYFKYSAEVTIVMVNARFFNPASVYYDI